MTAAKLPLKPIEENFAETRQKIVDERPAINQLVKLAMDRGFRNLFLVGCGGSSIASYPLNYQLQREASKFITQHVQAGEFNCSAPRGLGANSLVVAASYTGTTPETVEAAKKARAAGATVAAITKDATTPLAKAAEVVLSYGSPFTHGQLGFALLEATGEGCDFVAARQTFEALPEAIFVAEKEFEEHAHKIVSTFKGEPITYLYGSGPCYSAAYGFAMCYLQEMQWHHAAAFNSGELFHGAFEVVTEETPAILLLGEDATRPMAERAKKFLSRYTRKAEFVDTSDFTLPGITPAWRAFASPYVLWALMSRLARHYEAATGHDLEIRRYMFKVDY